MAITTITSAAISGASVHINTLVDATQDAIASAAGTLYAIEIDNTLNAAVSYVKLYDAASGSVTVGTTAPDWIFRVAASVDRVVIFPQGVAFGTALTIAGVTAGGTAGTTSPTSALTCRVVYA